MLGGLERALLVLRVARHLQLQRGGDDARDAEDREHDQQQQRRDEGGAALPVDLVIPGCPPTPMQMLEGLLALLEAQAPSQGR